MQKKALEKARKAYATGVDTQGLKARISKDLEPIKDAYDIAYQAMQRIESLLSRVELEDKPIRAMRELAAAMRDTAGVLTAMRDEGRASVRFATEAATERSAPSISAAPTPESLPAPESLPERKR